jgi:peptidoglycan/LPS O-acetylase OafA/YrhL
MDKKLWNLVRALFVAVLVVSVATLGVAAVIGGNWVVWLRGAAVAAASVWLVALAGQAALGKRSAYLRIRFISLAAPIGIVLILLAPDSGYPDWMKAEQGVVGVLVAAVAVIVNRRAVREAFPKRGKLG